MGQTKRESKRRFAEPRSDHILYPPETQDSNYMGSMMSQSQSKGMMF